MQFWSINLISFPLLTTKLKVVCNENQGGSGRWHTFGTYRSQTVAMEVCFPFKFAIVFDFIHFRFRPSKAKSIGNVLTNRQSAALGSMIFFLLYNAHCLLTHRIILYCVLRQCGVDRKKSPRNTIWKLKTLQNWTAMPNGATCIVASIY